MVTDRQVRRLMEMLGKGMSLGLAAAKAGMDEKTARKYRSLGQLPHEVRVDHDCGLGKTPLRVFGLRLKRSGRLIRVWKRRRSLKSYSDGIQVDSVMGNFGPCSVGSRSDVHCRGPLGRYSFLRGTNLGGDATNEAV